MSREARTSSDSAGEPSHPLSRGLMIGVCLAGGVLLVLAAVWILRDRPGGREPGSVEGVRPEATGEQPEPIEGLSNERFLADVESELDRLTPEKDGWDTETFSEAAASQLKRLGKKFVKTQAEHSKSESAPEIPLLSDEFTCGPLRPANLETVFDAGRVVVRRSAGVVGTAAGGPQVGASGLETALKACVAPLAPAAPDQIKFKVVQVEATSTHATTRVFFELVAHGRDKVAQQNAVWVCRWRRDSGGSPPRLLRIDVADFEETEYTGGAALFTDCTESLFGDSDGYRRQLLYGLNHWLNLLDWRFGGDVIGPHGLAVGDVNGDGLDDLYVCEMGGLPNRLLIQQKDGTVRDETARSGVDYIEPTSSALLVDLDNDADPDLVLACGTYLQVFANDGTGRFTREYSNGSGSLIRSITAVDYDLDGALDIYGCGYSSRQATPDGVGLGRPLPYHDANNGAPNFLLRNRGSWQFDEVTGAVGLEANNRRFSYAASWEDYDLDGDPDLYVANDFGRNNLYRNEGGTFVDVAAAAGVEDVAAGMSVSWGDYNRDGLPDLYVGNMFSSAGHRIAYQRRFKEAASSAVRKQYQRHARGNSLFENAGDGTFRDVSVAANVTMGRWAWGSRFVDINNDGWDDVVVANGMVTGADDPHDL